MRFGLPISFLLHAVAMGGGLFLFRATPSLPDDRSVIPVEILTVADITNIRASLKRPDNETIIPAKTDEPLDLVSETDDAPIDPQESVAQRSEVTPSEPALETPSDIGLEPSKEAAPVFDLDQLSALVDESRESQPSQNQPRIFRSEEELLAFADLNRRGAGEGTGLSLSEVDALRQAMYRCWRIPLDAKDPETLIIPVSVNLYQDGYVASARLKNPSAISRSQNPFMKIAADNALRAVSKCAPYDFLPTERYESWKEMTLTFRPVLTQ